MALKIVNKTNENISSQSENLASNCVSNGSSKNGHTEKANSVNKSSEMSESDKLTLRAWKHTYENRRKSKDK
jgi:hypothetical protein